MRAFPGNSFHNFVKASRASAGGVSARTATSCDASSRMTGADPAQGTDVTTKSGFDLTRPSMALNVAIPQSVWIRARVASVRAAHPEIRKRSGRAWAIRTKNSTRHAAPTMPDEIRLVIRDTLPLAHLHPVHTP